MFGKKRKPQRDEVLEEVQKLPQVIPLGGPAFQPFAKREQQKKGQPTSVEWEHHLHRLAQENLLEISNGLQHDEMQPTPTLIEGLADLAVQQYTHGYSLSSEQLDLVKEVFHTEYNQALQTRTFLNPYTGEFEDW